MARRGGRTRRRALYGIGFSAIVEPSVSNMGYITTVMPAEARKKAGPKSGAIASATVNVDLLGGVVVTVASTPAGQGHMTVCAQVVAGCARPCTARHGGERRVRYAQGRVVGRRGQLFEPLCGRGRGHCASRRHARARQDRAHRGEAVRTVRREDVCFEGGRIYREGRGGSRAAVWPGRRATAPHWAPALLPEGEEPGLRETVFWNPPNMAAPDENDRINTSAAYGFAFDMCGVEVDRATGRVRIDRYVTAHDAGTLLNPRARRRPDSRRVRAGRSARR